MTTVAIPVSVFRVECDIATGRPFATAERTVLKSIAAGNVHFDALKQDLALHPRIVAECLTALFEAGIIEFGQDAESLSITAIGSEVLADPAFIPANVRRSRKTFDIVVDRITGTAELNRNVTYERSDELRARGIPILPPSDLDPTPGRSVVRRLIERGLRTGEWVCSIGRLESRFRYNTAVQIDIREGRIERLRSNEWIRALTIALRERQFDVAEQPTAEPEIPWVSVLLSEVSIVAGTSEHAFILEIALAEASAYVFIHSAFLSGSRADQLAEPIGRALRRGVDVIIARGGSEQSSDADEQGLTVLRRIGYDNREAPGRFFFDPYPTASHAKVLMWDGKHVCIGSFNWLSARPDSGRLELSLLVSAPAFAAVVGDTVADLIREGRVVWPTQWLRSLEVAAPDTDTHEGTLNVRLIPDAYNRECLFAYLEQAHERLVVASDKVTPKEDPLLHERLLRKAAVLGTKGSLTIRFRGSDSPDPPILVGLERAGATIVQDGNNHAKAATRDDTHALVTSFNLLSFGGWSSRRASGFELGVEVHAVSPAPKFFERLLEILVVHKAD